MILSTSYTHEHLHVWKARKFGYKAIAYPKEDYAKIEGEMTKTHFVKISKAPLLYKGIFLTIPLSIFFYQNSIFVIIIYSILLTESLSDLYMVNYAQKKSPLATFEFIRKGEFKVNNK